MARERIALPRRGSAAIRLALAHGLVPAASKYTLHLKPARRGPSDACGELETQSGQRPGAVDRATYHNGNTVFATVLAKPHASCARKNHKIANWPYGNRRVNLPSVHRPALCRGTTPGKYNAAQTTTSKPSQK